ncbi:MAG: ribosome-associated translation inhibitor RaiA [Anaerolineae bacterium]|jgi:putative sigma-54 modulation protein|nr:MAG: ribosome-associated translation inhibitor RaiA [Anaerolineae bacterium]MCL4879933.1 ribosome-associated translation inhibitor RaiA [Anaerolineae bacterium]
MDIKIYSMNVNLSDKVKEYAERKLGKLDRYMPNLIEVRLELGQEKHKAKEQPMAQLTLRNNRGVILRAEDKKQDSLTAAVDAVLDKMYRQIERYKGKGRRKGSGSHRWLEPMAEWMEMEEVPIQNVIDYDEEPVQQIVKRKVVMLTPMSEQEAIDQMELLGHNFFLFFNGEEETVNVLYRREDNQYGILTPRID